MHKLQPGDWCRVNDKVPDLWEKMFIGGDGTPVAAHFVRVLRIGASAWPGLPIRAHYSYEPSQLRGHTYFYPRAALTFLFHEEDGHE